MQKQQIAYTPSENVCSKHILIETEGDRINQVTITGGCNGNTQGVSKLLEGMKIEEAIQRLEGIMCGKRGTSCPDQVAKALKQIGKVG